jgi:hypothetical protein
MKTQLTPFPKWLASLNQSRITGWRWRKRKIIEVINIHGRLYIHADEIARFEKRAAAGEFAAEPAGAAASR